MNIGLIGLISLLIATQSSAIARPHPAPDLEAVGRLRNLKYDHIDDPQDILGHGWITAEFRITRVLRGRAPSRHILIRYLAHTYRREDLPIRLRLRTNINGTYTVCAERGGDGLICGGDTGKRPFPTLS